MLNVNLGHLGFVGIIMVVVIMKWLPFRVTTILSIYCYKIFLNITITITFNVSIIYLCIFLSLPQLFCYSLHNVYSIPHATPILLYIQLCVFINNVSYIRDVLSGISQTLDLDLTSFYDWLRNEDAQYETECKSYIEKLLGDAKDEMTAYINRVMQDIAKKV